MCKSVILKETITKPENAMRARVWLGTTTPHMVLVYTIPNKIHAILPIKVDFGPFWGCFLLFLEILSLNLPILCAHLEERPQLWGCLFYNFYSYLEPFAIMAN